MQRGFVRHKALGQAALESPDASEHFIFHAHRLQLGSATWPCMLPPPATAAMEPASLRWTSSTTNCPAPAAG
jgi:hypothetical protein